MMVNVGLTSELTGPGSEHVRNIALMASVLLSHDPERDTDEAIDVAAVIYNRVARRYIKGLQERGEKVVTNEGV